jgi:hypothetical protein
MAAPQGAIRDSMIAVKRPLVAKAVGSQVGLDRSNKLGSFLGSFSFVFR